MRKPFVYRGVRFAPLAQSSGGLFWGFALPQNPAVGDPARMKFSTKQKCKEHAHWLQSLRAR